MVHVQRYGRLSVVVSGKEWERWGKVGDQGRGERRGDFLPSLETYVGERWGRVGDGAWVGYGGRQG